LGEGVVVKRVGMEIASYRGMDKEDNMKKLELMLASYPKEVRERIMESKFVKLCLKKEKEDE